MEVKYLVYNGPKKDGYITVSKESPLSAYRKLLVYPGKRFEIGVDIPTLTAKRVMDVLAGTFTIEVQVLDDLEAIKRQFKEIVVSYQKQFGEDTEAVVPALVVEALFGVLGDGAMQSLLTALRESDEIKMDIPEIKALVADVFKLEMKTTTRKKAVVKPKAK